MTINSFGSEKVIDGFSACFRQWKAEGTHCKFVHGYAVHFKLYFEGNLDERNWVWDFGGFKRANVKIKWDDNNGSHLFTPTEWFNYMFDHTTVVAENDPELDWFLEGSKKNILQLRVLPAVGCEMFAKLVFETIDAFLREETGGRVSLSKVECFEHQKNSASYSRVKVHDTIVRYGNGYIA